MKRGDGAEEMEEVAALETELVQTQTNYRKLSEHFDSYKEEMHTALCKQNDTINSLERERKDLDCLLGNLDSPVLKAKSNRQTAQLTSLLNDLKGCRQEILDELERLRKFNLEVDEVEDKLAAKRKEYGGSFGIFQRRVLLQRRLMRLENQHYHVSVAFNSVLTANRSLRERITNLRCERRMFDKIYKRLADQLDACKQQKAATLIVSNMALEQRHEAQSKIQALKERNEKEQQTFEITMRILERSMRNDAKLSEFMTVKFNERQEFKAEEASKRDKAIRAALEADKRTLNQYKEAFECIQEVSDEKEVDNMVKSFSTKEAENFALFNYITELDGQIEELHEELGVVQKDITALQKQEDDEMKQHEETMAVLEELSEAGVTRDTIKPAEENTNSNHFDYNVDIPTTWPQNRVEFYLLPNASHRYVKIDSILDGDNVPLLDGVENSLVLGKLRGKRLILDKVFQVRNRHRMQRFNLKKRHLRQQNGKNGVNEKLLAHGTSYANAMNICNNGFNRSWTGKNGSTFGQGTYCGNIIAHIAKFAKPDKQKDDLRVMLLVKALCGLSTVGKSEHREPPLNGSTGRRFDSCVDDVKSPTTFVFYDDDSVFAAYLVFFWLQ